MHERLQSLVCSGACLAAGFAGRSSHRDTITYAGGGVGGARGRWWHLYFTRWMTVFATCFLSKVGGSRGFIRRLYVIIMRDTGGRRTLCEDDSNRMQGYHCLMVFCLCLDHDDEFDGGPLRGICECEGGRGTAALTGFFSLVFIYSKYVLE